MKYSLYNSFSMLKKSSNVLLVYIFCMIIFVLYELNIAKQVPINNINLRTLGLLRGDDFLEYLMFILNFSVYIYIILGIFMHDFKNGGQNIFSRINKTKYFLYKLIYIFILIFIFKFFCHILVAALCKVPFECVYFIYDVNYTVTLCLASIFILLINQYKILVYVSYVCLFIVFMCISNRLLLHSTFIIFLCFNVLLFMINTFASKLLYNVYERND